MFTIGTYFPVHCGRALLEERHEPLARVVGGEAAGEALAQQRQRRLEIEIVLRGEGLEAEAHRDSGSWRARASVICFTARVELGGRRPRG